MLFCGGTGTEPELDTSVKGRGGINPDPPRPHCGSKKMCFFAQSKAPRRHTQLLCQFVLSLTHTHMKPPPAPLFAANDKEAAPDRE